VKNAGRERAAFTLALALAIALNVIVAAVLVDAATNHRDAGLSENATQILTGAFGGIIGILGTYLGYEHSIDRRHGHDIEPTETQEAPSQAPPDIQQGTPDE
jgi:hypothetical protein